ncbi:uncharacterized protein LOC135149931 [Daucus carota subsp. sativus]|uniref:uncharacterized protein LOC135149931 n=1 Tax=Daucus carota subsp. sativus TaxID=79200 RepID=UPI003083B107
MLTVFKTTITQFFRKYRKIEIKPVKLKSSQSGHNGEKSKQDPPLDIAQQPVIKTFPANTLEDMAPFLSQYALVMYNMDQVIKLDAEEGTSYLVTFTASLRDKSKIVETFETHICVPSLFPTMILEIRDISRRDLLATVPVEEQKGTKKLVAK